MLPFKLVYHERYDLNLGAHVFPSQKFRLIAEALLAEGIATTADFLRPEPASDEDILRVHTADWVRKLKTGTLTASEVMKLEVPYSPELVEAVWLAAGGTILAAQSALRDGFGANLGGGFHHAYPGHGEGFCAIHDVAVAIRRLQADKAVRKAMVVDTDAHHGNGTAAIFAGDESVFTISIHQENNYPPHKPPSNIDLNMWDRADDVEYLGELIPVVQKSLDDMDKGGVATEILSRSEPSVFFGNYDSARKLARETNDFAAKLISDYPGRFGMFATVPLPDVEGSLREIEYALDTLKMDGICMMTDYQGKFLGDPMFRPVLQELDRRKAVIYTHPFRNECCRNLVPDVFEPLIELGTDTTRTIASLLFSGSA